MLASVKALLSSVIDYAGLFPPAKLDMGQAMANYALYQTTPYSCMLGHFVVSASRLKELEELLPMFPLTQWSLSVILTRDWESEIDRVLSLHNNNQVAIAQRCCQQIASLEFPPLPPADIERVFPRLPAGVDCFFEIPFNQDLETYLSVLQQNGASAKIRTGGITANAFPSVTQLYQYVLAFAQARVPFKATAGLHHPLPGNHRLTYEPDSPSTTMHGFLNVAIVAAFVYWQKITLEEGLEVLKESASDRFQFQEDGIGWSKHQLNISQLEEVRQRFFRSFGSCSFQEPIDDLKTLKLLI
jgi:hypothetical protein